VTCLPDAERTPEAIAPQAAANGFKVYAALDLADEARALLPTV
jgi:hypothetical protein